MSKSKTLSLLIIFSMLYSSAFAEIKYPSRLHLNVFRWFSLTHDATPVGPILDHQNGEEYTRLVFRKLIDTAHNLAQEYYEEGSNQNYTYYAFLVAALTVPLHESRINHLRRSYGRKCKDDINQLNHPSMTPATAARLRPNYRDEYGTYGVLFPDCRYFDEEESIYQISASHDFSDYGIMQLNNYFHRHTTYPEYMLNVYNSIDYGLNYLFSAQTPKKRGTGGFKYIRANVSKAFNSCNFKTAPYKGGRAAIYYSLIQASWDRYNQGRQTVSSVCRFDKNPKSGHVVNFKRSLDSIAVKQNSVYHKYLAKDSLERKALDEIIHNFKASFKHKPEKNEFLSAMLAETSLEPTQDFEYTNKYKLEPTHVTGQSPATIFATPYPLNDMICGTIEQQSNVEIVQDRYAVSAAFNQDTKKNDIYVKVKLPHQASFVNSSTIQTMIKVKRAKLYVNVRKSPKVPKEGQEDNVLFKLDDEQNHGQLIQTKGSWGFIEFMDGRSGWTFIKSPRVEQFDIEKEAPEICKKFNDTFYMNLQDLESLESDMTFENGQIGVGTVTASSLVVRGAPSRNGEDLKHRSYLNDDVKVTEKHIDETGKLWYKIESLSAEKFAGWVSGKYINFKIVLN